MTDHDLEDAIRELCDSSGLSNSAIADVLDMLKVGYEMLEDEEEKED